MLSTTSQYALRALSHLARQDGKAVLGQDLARAVEVPANYLSKVLVTLRNAGLVDTLRGSGGGYRLARPAEGIRLIDVVELFEEISRSRPTCFLGRTRECSETEPCTAHTAWSEVQKAYLRFLVSTPLSAIAGNPGDAWHAAAAGATPPAGHSETEEQTGGSK